MRTSRQIILCVYIVCIDAISDFSSSFENLACMETNEDVHHAYILPEPKPNAKSLSF